MPAILIDTNILVYAHDINSGERYPQSIAILSLLQLRNGVLSAQTLAEFFSVITRPQRGNPARLNPGEALAQVEALSSSFPVLTLTPQVVIEAARGVRDHRLPYFDAQVWATARLNQVPVIFSEDFQDGLVLEGVRFVNPLASGFDLEQWG